VTARRMCYSDGAAQGMRNEVILMDKAGFRRYEQAVAEREHTSKELYDAEVALHDARQAGVDSWIAAASEHLHRAVLHDMAARRAVDEIVEVSAA
jgi:hypothetical protein